MRPIATDEAVWEVADTPRTKGSLTATALLQQAGYLTIKDYDPDGEDYTLGVPDEEVRRDLSTLVAGVAAERA